jgi:serine/threonine-protein kinase
MRHDDKWEQVQDIFLAVADRTAVERKAAMERLCAGDAALRTEVESAARSREHRRGKGADGHPDRGRGDGARNGREGRCVGAYRLIRENGCGGMGTVYRTVRADGQCESEAAIKLVKPGLDTDLSSCASVATG